MYTVLVCSKVDKIHVSQPFAFVYFQSSVAAAAVEALPEEARLLRKRRKKKRKKKPRSVEVWICSAERETVVTTKPIAQIEEK